MSKTARARESDRRPGASERLVGRYRGAEEGPLLVCVGGIHGNEPAGVEALRRVLARLVEERPGFRGEVVGVAGNLEALARSTRFVDEDLNRIWTLERVARVRERGDDAADGGGGSTEEGEMAGVLGLLDSLLPDDAGGRDVYFVDLHTTSSESVPFVTLSDSLTNRAFARQFPLPLVLGLEEELEGTLLDYVDHLGHVAIGIEGGSHRAPASVDHLERAVWLALASLEMVGPDAAPDPGRLRSSLARAAEDVPPLFEVRYRHALREGDGYRMDAGFRNFQEVAAGEVVGRDRRGRVRAPEAGRLFLPLYQDQGEEGFFVVRRVAPFWLRVSALLRRLRADRLARHLPGVRPHPEREGAARREALPPARLSARAAGERAARPRPPQAGRRGRRLRAAGRRPSLRTPAAGSPP